MSPFIGQLFVAVAACLLMLAVACSSSDNNTTSSGSSAATATAAASAGFPLTVKDDKGSEVTLKAPAKRIVALQPSFVEVLFAVGGGGSVAAADQNTNYPPEAASVPKLSGFSPSVEGIAAQTPDLVLIQFDPGGLQDALKTLSIPVLFLASPASLQGVFDQMATLGKVSGHAAEAENLVSGMKKDIDDLTARIPSGTGPRVFHEVDNTLYTVGPGSFINDYYATLKAQSIAQTTGQAFPQMSAEAVIKADPQVIILADEQAGESPQTVAARPGWDQVSAVKNSRVYAVDPDIISRPGPRIGQALKILAHDLYPDTFP